MFITRKKRSKHSSKSRKIYSLGLLQYFYQSNPTPFIRIIKRNAPFLLKDKQLLTLLKDIFTTEHQYLIASFDCFIKQRAIVHQQEQKLTQLLASYPIEELLFLLSTWLDKQYVDAVKKEVAYNIINPLEEAAFSYVLDLKKRSKQALVIDASSLNTYSCLLYTSPSPRDRG